MTKTARMLLAAAASVAIAGGSASSAMAFEGVEWNWKKWIWEKWDINVDVDAHFKPDTIVQIEKLQIAFGDHKAFAKTEDITNDPFGDKKHDVYKPRPTKQLAVRDQRKGQKKFNWPDPRPKVRLLPLGALPKLENIATAVANNQTIEVSATGTAALFLHDAQIAAGEIKPIRRAPVCSYDYLKKREICYDVALDDNGMLDALSDMGSGNSHDPDNFHTDLAGLVFLGALLGVIEPAKIEATAIVEDIKNVTVENVATAVGNNASYTLEALSPADGEGDGNEDHMAGFNTRFGHFDFGDRDKVKVDARAVMVADITQLLIGDTKATAITKDVDIEGYNLAGINTDMGDLAGNNRPLVSNVATAVGNNLNIKVTACGTCE